MDPTETLLPAGEDALSAPPSFGALIESTRRRLQMSHTDVRIAHWACGGNAHQAELVAFLQGRAALPGREYNALAAAINDRLLALRRTPTIPYIEDDA